MKMKDDEVTAERNQVVHQETIFGNFYIKTKDLEDHGYTAKCRGCVSMLRGTTRQAHSIECRKRIEGILKNTERYKRADHRLTTFLTDRLKKDDEGRRRRRELRVEVQCRLTTLRMEHTSASSAGPTADEQRKKAGAAKHRR